MTVQGSRPLFAVRQQGSPLLYEESACEARRAGLAPALRACPPPWGGARQPLMKRFCSRLWGLPPPRMRAHASISFIRQQSLLTKGGCLLNKPMQALEGRVVRCILFD